MPIMDALGKAIPLESPVLDKIIELQNTFSFLFAAHFVIYVIGLLGPILIKTCLKSNHTKKLLLAFVWLSLILCFCFVIFMVCSAYPLLRDSLAGHETPVITDALKWLRVEIRTFFTLVGLGMMFIAISLFRTPRNLYAEDEFDLDKEKDFITQFRPTIQAYSCAGTMFIMTMFILKDIITEPIEYDPIFATIAGLYGLYFIIANFIIFVRSKEAEPLWIENFVKNRRVPIILALLVVFIAAAIYAIQVNEVYQTTYTQSWIVVAFGFPLIHTFMVIIAQQKMSESKTEEDEPEGNP